MRKNEREGGKGAGWGVNRGPLNYSFKPLSEWLVDDLLQCDSLNWRARHIGERKVRLMGE